MALTWNDLFLCGSVVDLHTSKWRGRVHIKPADLGIADSEEVARALILGTHRLAPADAYQAIDEVHAKARRAIDHFSMPFGFVRGARYVPEVNAAPLAERLRQLSEEFNEAVGAFIGNYERIKEEMLPVLQKALQDAARTPEAASAALERLVAEYPSASDVRAKFTLRWNVYAISGPSRKGAEAAMEDEASAVKDMVRGMVRDLRDELKVKLAEVLALILKGGKLQQRSIDAAFAVIDHIESVNILGDEVLAKQARELRGVLSSLATNQRVPDAMVTGLEQIKQALVTDIDEAVAAAERKLTAPGRRKLARVA